MNTNLSVHKHNTLPVIEPAIIVEDGYEISHLVHQSVKPLMFVELNSPLDNNMNSFLKRLFDVVVSSILILGLLSWLIPLMAICIRIDSRGPLFFIQKRMKKGGRYFSCIKFRTMICNPEADTLAATENDRRITRLGQFLRNHHLDELPQLLNVLYGDMSLIGPRPHMIMDNMKFETLVDNYASRHKVKPGITGLAQVNGYVGCTANLDNMKKRVEKDMFYIRNWSFALDAKIMIGTVRRMMGTNN
jgi:putative colanic acid biosysnthesis UDP-glucose lipid carrier transferase